MKSLVPITVMTLLLSCQQNDERYLQESLQNVFEKHELMGMAVVLIEHGEVSFTANYGLANLAQNRKLDDQSRFRVASISKTITAMAIFQLWEKNLIDLDSDISEILGWTLRNPKFPDEMITLQHLMNHTSGIRDGTGYGSFIDRMFRENTDIRELFTPKGEFFTEDMFSDKSPGSYFTYTNCTWGLVAGIVEKVSGERFDRYCKKNIFESIGIGASYNILDILADQVGAIYRAEDGEWVAQVDDYTTEAPKDRGYPDYIPGTNGLMFGPQGSLRASASDLSTITRLFLNMGSLNGRQILKPETIDFWFQDQWIFNGENGDTWDSFWSAYGLGLHRIENREGGDIIFPDRKMLGHPGIAYGLLSDMYFDPITKSGIVFITNGSKNEFPYAEKSSFYQVEADVFEILYAEIKKR